LHDAGSSIALTTDSAPLANLPSGPLGIPGIVLSAYLRAQQTLATQEPNCHLPWWLLAGIGKVESGQAENGEVDANGNTLRPILGPVLDGSGGFAAVPDTDHGVYDGNTTWDRAVGPMQFLPSTWREYGQGGNPNNVFDAAAAAGRYLCSGGGNLADPTQQAIAVFSYNHSDSYVRLVLIWANAYRQGVTPLPETVVPPIVEAKAPGTPAPGVPVVQVLPNGTTTTVTTTTSPAPGGGTTTTTVTTTAKPGGSTTTTTTTTTTATDKPTTTTTTTTTTPPCTTTTTPTSTTSPTSTTTPPPSTTTTTPTTTTTTPSC
jgi:hypothetical protein